MTEKNEKWFRYVPFSREKAYEAIGWEFDSYLPLPHACYASLYIWRGEGEPVDPPLPEKKIDNTKKELNNEW